MTMNNLGLEPLRLKKIFPLVKLHKYIQAIVEFDDDHLYEFFIGKNGLS